MKSAYELAMERTGGAPKPLTDEQKEQIAEINRKMDARLAEQNILFDQRIAEARAVGDMEALQKAEANRETELRRIRDEADRERDGVRGSA